ncbi:MAG: penicillin acylase family protein, partial [Pseudomonadota bacterium]
MARVFQWLVRLVAGLIALCVLGVLLVYYLGSRSLPDYDDTLQVPGIGSEVEIVRDNANVPHIFGQSDEDVLFALGFAHAQDRLWQMTMLRRTAQGRLSEVFGRTTLEIDTFVRRLDLYGLAVRSVE